MTILITRMNKKKEELNNFIVYFKKELTNVKKENMTQKTIFVILLI